MSINFKPTQVDVLSGVISAGVLYYNNPKAKPMVYAIDGAIQAVASIAGKNIHTNLAKSSPMLKEFIKDPFWEYDVYTAFFVAASRKVLYKKESVVTNFITAALCNVTARWATQYLPKIIT